jgi:hypothetical protein
MEETMQTLIVNYSKTGNNAVLADYLEPGSWDADRAEIHTSEEADHVPYNLLDMMFSRKPKLRALDKNPRGLRSSWC